MKTVYETSWHYTAGKLTRCTVTPITVIREGILPGCTAPSITAVDSKGRTFQGSARDYYASEADAWADIKSDLSREVRDGTQKINQLQAQLDAVKSYLETLK